MSPAFPYLLPLLLTCLPNLRVQGELTGSHSVLQEAGAAEQLGCDPPGPAAVPPAHRPPHHEGECTGAARGPLPPPAGGPGAWVHRPGGELVLETEASEEQHFQRSNCTSLGCSERSRSRWFLEISLQHVQTPSATEGRACQWA